MNDERNKDTGLNQEDTANKQETANEEQSQSTLPKTQEELDAVIEARVARERQKWMKRQGVTDKQTKQSQEQRPQTDAGQDPATNAAMLKMQRDLITAKMQIEAIKSNIRADVAEDAVYLAVRTVEQRGDELDEADMQEALNDVKKRHPEWVIDDKAKGGFKVGADPDKKDTNQKHAMLTGTVIM